MTMGLWKLIWRKALFQCELELENQLKEELGEDNGYVENGDKWVWKEEILRMYLVKSAYKKPKREGVNRRDTRLAKDFGINLFPRRLWCLFGRLYKIASPQNSIFSREGFLKMRQSFVLEGVEAKKPRKINCLSAQFFSKI